MIHLVRFRLARRSARRLAFLLGPTAVLALTAALALPAAPIAAHSADPSIGGLSWSPNQVVPYAWAAGQVPPAWMQSAFNGAANDANQTRASQAAVFSLQSSGSLVAYGEPTGCSATGIACFSRSAPGSFRIWYRAHGAWFDWGQLRWCQGPSGYVSGCYDAETVGLDELGHVEGLDHHVNWSDSSDYGDAVVQSVSRSYPRAGSTARGFARCDVARLQLTYDRLSSWDSFSACLSIASETGMGVSALSITSGGAVLFTATLRTTPAAAAGALSGGWISGRTMILERRFPGAATWTAVTTLTPQAAEGYYAAWVTITGTYEWRARFPSPSGEGVQGSASGTALITARACSVCPYGAASGAATTR